MTANQPSASRNVVGMLGTRRQDSERVDEALHEALQAYIAKTGALPTITALTKQAGVGRSTIYRKLESGDTPFARLYKKLDGTGTSRTASSPPAAEANASGRVQIAILRKKIDDLEAELKAKNQEIATLKHHLAVCRGQLRQQAMPSAPTAKR